MKGQEITDEIQKAFKEDTDRAGRVIFKGLLEDVPINRIPESVFINSFLPLFIGAVETPPENWMLTWVGIAGNPMSEVIVYQDSSGEELYRVPAIFHTTNIFMHKTEGDIGDIFGRYNQISQNVPTTGLRFLIEALNSKSEQLLEAFDNKDTVRRWHEILKRYNLITEKQTLTENQAQNDNIENYFDF